VKANRDVTFRPTRSGTSRGFVMLVGAVLLLLAATGLLSWSLVQNLRDAEQDRLTLQAESLSRTLADSAQRQIDVADLLLQFAAAETSERISRGLTPSDAIIKLLESRLEAMPQVKAVHVYDERGRYWFAVGSVGMPLDIGWHPGFTAHRDGVMQQISAAQLGTPDNENTARIWLTRRIGMPGEPFAGVLIATLNLDLQDLLDPAYFTLPTAALAMVHDGGPLIAGWPRSAAQTLTGLTTFVSGSHGHAMAGDSMLYWAKLSDLPVTLLMQIDMALVQSNWQRPAIGYAVLFGVFALGAIATLWGNWRQLRRRTATEALLRGMMDNPPLIMALQDADGRYLMVNRHYAEQLGREPDSLVGRTPRDIFPPAMAGELMHQISQTLQAGKAIVFDSATRIGTVEQRDYIVVRFPIYDAARRLLALGSIATDITERKQLEAELREQAAVREKLAENYARQREVAETANRAKSEFLAHMSHELRTPLNAIIGFADMIAGRLLGAQSDKYFEYARDISGSAHHLLGVINDILDVSKIESGRFVLEQAVHDPYDLVEDSLRLVKGRAREAGLQVHNRLPHELPRLHVDARAVKQMLINLLGNAVKFTPQGGTITVEAVIETSGGMAITVADTGIGIAEENLEKVFEPFWQADAGVRRSEGSGLGLNICRKLIDLHQGRVSVTSVLQQGTRVTLHFPPACIVPAQAAD